MRCDDYQNRLLDLVYGLLDPAEAAALEAHVAGCPACTAAAAAARGEKTLIARAAKASFPQVRFVPPADGGVVEPRRAKTSRAVLVRWAVAAGVVLAVAGTVGPTVHSLIRAAATGHDLRAALDGVRNTKQVWQTEQAALAGRTVAARNVLESATTAHDAVLTDWVRAESDALAAKAFAVTVTGPASAVAGAVNEYKVRVTDAAGGLVPAAIEAVVADVAGKVRADAKYEPAAVRDGTTFRLPASAWTDLPDGAGLTLTLSTTDPATGRKSPITEPINLTPPVYATHLATDRPLYQPGETIYFRSVTLDRATFRPPDRDLALRYILLDAKGNPVPGLTLSGSATPAAPGKGGPEAILGPDGKPVRGVGSGAFTLSPTLAAGEYALAAYELPTGWTKPELPAGSVPLAKRTVRVHTFAPSALATNLEFDASSYGPGDSVTATFSAAEQGRPLAQTQILTSVTVNGKSVPVARLPFNLDDRGRAAIRFDLPNDAALARAEVKVTLLHGPDGEIITRAVPLALKTVRVEFFPEGGDLVAGVEGRVYFRAHAPDDKPVEFRGDLFDGEKVVATVATVGDKDQPGANRGLGTFTFTPQAGKRYLLRGPSGEFPLPAAKAGGISLAIPNGVLGADQPIAVRLAAPARTTVVVGAYTRGRPVATARAVLEPGKVTDVELKPAPGSPGGVTRVTVFEESSDEAKTLTPRAERLIFRRPAEALVLNYSATAPAVPGSPVALTIMAQSEAGRPVGAILWAAVVSATDFGRADDRTGRGLLAHFYLCGDVEKPDDLEFADFLLTDHPKAAESLDLVLGTQGWRRFAEQSPETFRRTAPAAGRLLVAAGLTGPVPAAQRPLVPRIADRYQPRYQRALESVEAAEKASNVDGSAAERAKSAYASFVNVLSRANASSPSYEWSAYRIPAAAGFLLAAVILAVVRSRQFRTGDPERKYLTAAALAAVALAGFLVAAMAFGTENDRTDVAAELQQAAGLGIHPQPLGPAGRPIAATTVAPQSSAVGQGIASLESPGLAGGSVKRSNPATSGPPGAGSPLESAADGQPTVRMMLAANPSATAALASEFATRVRQRLAAAVPPGPAGDKVRDAVPKLPPLVVREYAHAGPNVTAANRNLFDATDTVLWQPVVVVPGTGTFTLNFSLSGSPAGYRILIAGHTPDGRIGSVSGTLPVGPAK